MVTMRVCINIYVCVSASERASRPSSSSPGREAACDASNGHEEGNDDDDDDDALTLFSV